MLRYVTHRDGFGLNNHGTRALYLVCDGDCVTAVMSDGALKRCDLNARFVDHALKEGVWTELPGRPAHDVRPAYDVGPRAIRIRE